ncbi:MAG TPA: GAF domain-containing protein, partial [Albitalea sp.]|nr:GAF domain-containing protein [Albitalea sp.]
MELITVYEICRILGTSLDIERTFRAALNVLAAHLGLPRAMIVMPDEDGIALEVHSSVGLSRDEEMRGRWRRGEGVIGHVYASAMPVVVPDVAQAPEFIDRTGAFGAHDARMMAFVVVPLKADTAVVGVLAAQREVRGGARLADDQRILTMVATLLARASTLHDA